jgi:Transmembrane protein 43
VAGRFLRIVRADALCDDPNREDTRGPIMSDDYQSGAGPSDSFTETTHQSWLSRIGQSIMGVLIGFALVVGSAALLFWNEGRAVQTARSLGEGERQVVEADQAKVDPANQDKLIHVSGNLATKVPLADPEFGISTPAARLVRTVETYQWKQETHTETHKNLGGSEDKVTTYTYVQTWSEPHIESSRFHEPNGHVNPPQRYRRLEVVARDATLGAFRPGEAALRRLAAADEYAVDPAVVTALRDRLGNATVVDGKIFVGADPAKPRIGDLRVTFHIAPVGPVSLIGQQTGVAVTEFQTKAGDRLLMARQGSITANDMFKIAEAENRVLTWVLRAVGAVLMFVGWALVGGPLSVLGSVVPLIGDVIGFGTGAVAFLMTAIVVPVVIAIAWLWYRPLVSIVVLAIGFAIVYAIRTRTGRRAVPAPAT